MNPAIAYEIDYYIFKQEIFSDLSRAENVQNRKLLKTVDSNHSFSQFSSQFSYCPLIWMFHSKKMEHRINSIHKRALKLVYQDSPDLTFQEVKISQSAFTKKTFSC